MLLTDQFGSRAAAAESATKSAANVARAAITVAACDVVAGDLWIMQHGGTPEKVTAVVRLSPATVQLATAENEGTTYDLDASDDVRVIR